MKLGEFLSTIPDYEEMSLLPNNIAVGDVLKVRVSGDIREDNEEWGYLYLPKGTKILPHTHIDDMEKYELIFGKIIINGKEAKYNTCLPGKQHSIDMAVENSLIKYNKTKVLKKDKKINENPKSYKKTC